VEILISEEAIRARVVELGRAIEDEYRDRQLTIVAVLTGSLVFLADLMRQIRIPHRVGLYLASSYAGAVTEPGPELRIDRRFQPDVAGRDVLLLDDILDTGRTLGTLATGLREQGAASVRVAVLLRKLGRQVVPIEPDYVGFEIPDAFVVGYGLDFDDDYRHLPYIAVLDGRGQ
jgi:hypoxanthine phosphoribosyltransferase